MTGRQTPCLRRCLFSRPNMWLCPNRACRLQMGRKGRSAGPPMEGHGEKVPQRLTSAKKDPGRYSFCPARASPHLYCISAFQGRSSQHHFLAGPCSPLTPVVYLARGQGRTSRRSSCCTLRLVQSTSTVVPSASGKDRGQTQRRKSPQVCVISRRGREKRWR